MTSLGKNSVNRDSIEQREEIPRLHNAKVLKRFGIVGIDGLASVVASRPAQCNSMSSGTLS